MGLTYNSMGIKSVDTGLVIKKIIPNDKVIALAGNPNVGKSTVFNNLTGLNQHTGNWPGKTVTNAQGICRFHNENYVMVDIPGTYSLMAHSVEEEIARDFICFGNPDAVVVVCDATCLERNLNLVLQTIEITEKVVVCVNLMDEARRKNITINLNLLSARLGVPVIGTTARKKNSLEKLMQAVHDLLNNSKGTETVKIEYVPDIENAISQLQPVLFQKYGSKINSRWLAIRLLDFDETLAKSLIDYFGCDILLDQEIKQAVESAKCMLSEKGINSEDLRDKIVSGIVHNAERICSGAVVYQKRDYNSSDRKIDKLLTSKRTGIPVMMLLLMGIFWLTIFGANYPSQLLSSGLFWIQDKLTELFTYVSAPDWLHGVIVLGVYRVVAWVVSVMLPPMAIFFPLFTLLEDCGYLPRVAFNMDNFFRKACAHGKQALTMCMVCTIMQ